MKLLCLSNGHGEDVIAVSVLRQLLSDNIKVKIAALPLVGEGSAYTQLNIPIIAPIAPMPSGGFIYMDVRKLWQDLQFGLIGLSLTQYQTMRQWISITREPVFILAVGDIVPLLFAWLSGANYGFIGTAKSEYYLRNESDWLPETSLIAKAIGSVYFPWECWLMSHRRCQGVFPRDPLTSQILQQQQSSIPVFDLGNPMMDYITCEDKSKDSDKLIVLLLPGSRSEETIENWHRIIQAVTGIISRFRDREIWFLGAIAPCVSLTSLSQHLLSLGWCSQSLDGVTTPIFDPEAQLFSYQQAYVILSQNAYKDCLLAAQVAIATAGTATEQFVGLGKPVITIPGNGPQFTLTFALNQTRLLGPSVIMVKSPELVADTMVSLLNDAQRLELIAANGRQRMGLPGASTRIAHCLREIMSKPN